ncbi:MAG: EamA family transporter [Calditrichia bacterium]|nr:DMT family transporter [Calditrichota bacterium]MCB0269197.1 DMT family transporter [Calditrichota bacterium]MCB0288277.1 DMT family transporter [Calditrichota bacterium]MCB9067305.1 DMT family transporter [Calditrichia bacterium]
MKNRYWLFYALITTLFWGIWGAIIEIPEKGGFPATLGYAVWALTMIPPMLVALKNIDWKLERNSRAILLGSAIGFLGAGGQLVLFEAVRISPAYLLFPIISLSPVVTILLSYMFLKERASARGWIGILLALVAIPLLSYSEPADGQTGTSLWVILALLVFLAWGIQAYVMKFANETMKAESIFFYMTVTGLLLIPFALWMTDFSQEINWGFSGPGLTYLIQTLNAVGALCIVYAFRYGKAMIVSPLTNAGAPVITIILSLIIYQHMPHWIILCGMLLAVLSAFLMAIEEE